LEAQDYERGRRDNTWKPKGLIKSGIVIALHIIKSAGQAAAGLWPQFWNQGDLPLENSGVSWET